MKKAEPAKPKRVDKRPKIDLTEEQLALVKEAAESRKMSLTKYAGQAALDQAMRDLRAKSGIEILATSQPAPTATANGDPFKREVTLRLLKILEEM